jgi:hypothetical protein
MATSTSSDEGGSPPAWFCILVADGSSSLRVEGAGSFDRPGITDAASPNIEILPPELLFTEATAIV